MTKHRDAFTHATERELEHWPGVHHRFEFSKKHRRVVISWNGRERFVIFPTSASDNIRGPLGHVTNLKVELRALGARRVERTPLTERRKRNVAAPRPTPAPEISDPRPDGWLELRQLHARLHAEDDAPVAPTMSALTDPGRSIWDVVAEFFLQRAA